MFARNHTWTVYGYFISNRTLQLAVTALPWDKNNYTIEAVAKDAGFSSRKTFQTRFKDKFGMTPSQYRLSKSSPHE